MPQTVDEQVAINVRALWQSEDKRAEAEAKLHEEVLKIPHLATLVDDIEGMKSREKGIKARIKSLRGMTGSQTLMFDEDSDDDN